MKIKILLLSLIMPALLMITTVSVDSQARDIVCQGVDNIDPACRTGADRIFGPGGLVDRIVGVLTFIIGAAAVIIIIIAGLMYVLSGGNPENTKRAKDAIVYAVVGLVVAIAARLIVGFVIANVG